MVSTEPDRPKNIPIYAQACLEALKDLGLGEKISLGDAFGLSHYLDYRSTNDVDAWWTASASPRDKNAVIHAIQKALHNFGELRTREWGEVVSSELIQEDSVFFSFQIAQRSAQLQPSSLIRGSGVFLDSLPDIIASKMVALVERGAPRDFRDIYAVCEAGLADPQNCWVWWRKRQIITESDADADRARTAIATHLARISKHRPLDSITDTDQRRQADQVRNWFREDFLNVQLD